MDDLSAEVITAGLAGTRFREVAVHESLDSTQGVLVAEGGPDGRVVVADHQTAGKGRLGRSWAAPPCRALLFSVLLREPAARAPVVSLAAGLAVARAVRALCGLHAVVKWPNDVLIDALKVCGILGEVSSDGSIVLGIGVNVRQTQDEMPAGATSIAAQGADVRRDDLLVAILRELGDVLASRSFLDAYRSLCDTIGRRVRVEVPGESFEGVAERVDDDGALVVSGRVVMAGDVVHVR